VPKSEQPLLSKPAPLPTAALSEDERLACLRLIRSENVGPVTFRELINHFGGAANAIAAIPELSRRGGSGRPIRLCAKADAERELDAARRVSAVPVFTIEPDYPALLARSEAPPPMVYIKGGRDLLNRPAVAIVGSRQCSAAGVQLTRRFAIELGEAGFVIVSGLARGIDRAAHEASLNRGTVAVLAGGIDWIYPPEHSELQNRVGTEGCLVTERPPGFQPRDKDFPRRNRIIAGLVHGVVIIEAATRSGTLVTARYANDLGREVFALPGHPLDARAEGTNRLIKQGATLVTGPEEVIEVLRPILGLEQQRGDLAAAHSQAAPSGARPPLAGSSASAGDKEMNAVLAALGPAPVAVDEIARATGLSVQNV
jgi:DNA processing protein